LIRTEPCGCRKCGRGRLEVSPMWWSGCCATLDARCSGRRNHINMTSSKRRRHTPDQIIRKLAEGNKLLSSGQHLDEVCLWVPEMRSWPSDRGLRGHVGAENTVVGSDRGLRGPLMVAAPHTCSPPGAQPLRLQSPQLAFRGAGASSDRARSAGDSIHLLLTSPPPDQGKRVASEEQRRVTDSEIASRWLNATVPTQDRRECERPAQNATTTFPAPTGLSPRHTAALAPATNRPPLDPTHQRTRTAIHNRRDPPTHHRHGHRQPDLGLPPNPRRTRRPRSPCRSVHGLADPQAPRHRSRAGPTYDPVHEPTAEPGGGCRCHRDARGLGGIRLQQR
jgi:hypothetical protein